MLVILLFSMALPSCSHLRIAVEPPVALPDSVVNDRPAVELPDRWWLALGDENLNVLIAQALRDNFSLRVAWDRLRQAKAISAGSRSAFWPTVDVSAGASRTRRVDTVQTEEVSVARTIVSQTASRVLSDITGGGDGESENSGTGGQNVTVTKPQSVVTYQTDLSLGLVASYEVDLWGRIRSTHDAAMLDVLATAEDLQAAAITLSARIATTYFTLIEQRAQLDLLGLQLRTNEDYLEIITTRFRHGQVSATDVLQERQLVENTRGGAIPIRSNIEVLEHQLAVLLGRPPGQMPNDVVAKDLPSLPDLPAMGLPANLLHRRPDVRSAVFRVQAGDQRVAAAIADQLPQLGLTVRAETSAAAVRDLFDNWLASLAANLLAPVLDGGRRTAEVRRTRAVVSERINNYGQVLLTSLQEVEDALSQEARQSEYLASIRKQLDLSNQATTQTLDRYTKGTTDFVRYLTTLLAHQGLQRQYLAARRELVRHRVDLYRSLGGSWEMRAPAQATPVKRRERESSPDSGMVLDERAPSRFTAP